ncbi:MAG: hypothetical protein L0226_03245 [Acidobacteria bacterium]|nr:hypothetical protein [Acidobacteriota bacterium]
MIHRCFNRLILPFILLFSLTATATAQEVFEDPDGQYTVTLPAGWIAVVNQDSLGRKDVNIVFKIRENGALKVRRVDDSESKLELIDYAKKDEEQTVRFLPAYDKLTLENFLLGGGKTGTLLSYDFKNAAGQPFTGRNYYLRSGEKIIYVLRFTGRKNTLGTLRNQTDAIARSFKAK